MAAKMRFLTEEIETSLLFRSRPGLGRSTDALAFMRHGRCFADSSKGSVWKFPWTCALAAGALRLVRHRRHVQRKAKPSDMGKEVNINEVKDLKVIAAEEVRTPTQGLGSWFTSVYHKGTRIQAENGKSYIVDLMPPPDGAKKPDPNARVLHDNSNWKDTNTPINVRPGSSVTVGDIHHAAAAGDKYNLVCNNCVQAKDRMRRELEGTSEGAALQAKVSSVAGRVCKSVVGDALNGKEVNPKQGLSHGVAGVVEETFLSTTGSRPLSVAAASSCLAALSSGEKWLEAGFEAACRTFPSEWVQDLIFRGKYFLPFSFFYGRTSSREGGKNITRSGLHLSGDFTDGLGLCHWEAVVGQVDSEQTRRTRDYLEHEVESVRGVGADVLIGNRRVVNLDTGTTSRDIFKHREDLWGFDAVYKHTEGWKLFGLQLWEETKTRIRTTSDWFHSHGTTTRTTGTKTTTTHHYGFLDNWFIDSDSSGHIGPGRDAHLMIGPAFSALECFVAQICNGVSIQDTCSNAMNTFGMNQWVTCLLAKGLPFAPIRTDDFFGVVMPDGKVLGLGKTERCMQTLSGEEWWQEHDGLSLGIPVGPFGVLGAEVKMGHVATATSDHYIQLEGVELDMTLPFNFVVFSARAGVVHEEISTHDDAENTDIERISDGLSLGIVESSEFSQHTVARSGELDERWKGNSTAGHFLLYDFEESKGHFVQETAGASADGVWMETFEGEKHQTSGSFLLHQIPGPKHTQKTGEVHRHENHHSDSVDSLGIVRSSTDSIVETDFDRKVMNDSVTDSPEQRRTVYEESHKQVFDKEIRHQSVTIETDQKNVTVTGSKSDVLESEDFWIENGEGILHRENVFLVSETRGPMHYDRIEKSVIVEGAHTDVQLRDGPETILLLSFIPNMFQSLQQGHVDLGQIAERGSWLAGAAVYGSLTGASLGYAFRFGIMVQEVVEVHGKEGSDSEKEELTMNRVRNWACQEGFVQVAQGLFLLAPLPMALFLAAGGCFAQTLQDQTGTENDGAQNNKT